MPERVDAPPPPALIDGGAWAHNTLAEAQQEVHVHTVNFEYTEERRREDERLAAERAAAQDAARASLLAALDDEQRRTFQAAGHFDVPATDGRVYRVSRGFVNNVLVLGPDGRRHSVWCVVLDGARSVEEHMHAQLVWLRADPARLGEIAVVSF